MTIVNTPTHGEIVTWNLSRLFLTKSAVEAALRNAGFNVRIRNVRPSTYLKRAIGQCIEEGTVRKIGETREHVMYAVVEEHGDMSIMDYHTTMVEAIRLNKVTQALEFKRNTGLTRAIREAVKDNEGGLLSNDVGQLLRDVVLRNLAGVALRQRGGAYFVPHAFTKQLNALENAFQGVLNKGGSLTINRFSTVMDARSADDLSRIYTTMVMEELEGIADEVRGYATDIVKAKPSTFVKRIAQLKARIKQLGVYSATLSAMSFDDETIKIQAMLKILERCRVRCVAARAARREKNK